MALKTEKLFIGRDGEMDRMSAFLDRLNPGIAILYGRRRVGKTEIIRNSLRGRVVLNFEGIEGAPTAEQIDAFVFQFAEAAGEPWGGRKPRRWRPALRRLVRYIESCETPPVVVFDEFQWMANYRAAIVADLKMIWDQYWSGIPGAKLILCGSIAGFMKEKVVKSSALYGRSEEVIHLREFSLAETAQLLPRHGEQEVLEAQMLVGGVPQYLTLLRNFPSVRIAMDHLAFTKDGYLAVEFDRIFVSHFGKNPEYEQVVRVLAKHPMGLTRAELAAKAGARLGGNLSSRLENLESAGFISSHTPVDKPPGSRFIKYELGDAYLRFYFAFIAPNLKKLDPREATGLFERVAGSPAFHPWMGRSFELVCRAHAKRISEILGFPGIEFTAGSYFRPARKGKPGVQMDLVFLRADNVITLCEMKYKNTPVGVEVLPELHRRVDDLRAAFPKKTIQSVLIVANGATRELEASLVPSRIVPVSELFAG